MIARPAALALFLGSAPIAAQDMPAMQMGSKSASDDAQVVVTINPEVRVSAALGKVLAPMAACGTPVALRVKVINQAGATAPLLMRLVDAPPGVSLSWESIALSGHPDDKRILHITSHRRGATDLTLAFSLTGAPGDMADRDRVHVLLRCTTISASANESGAHN